MDGELFDTRRRGMDATEPMRCLPQPLSPIGLPTSQTPVN